MRFPIAKTTMDSICHSVERNVAAIFERLSILICSGRNDDDDDISTIGHSIGHWNKDCCWCIVVVVNFTPFTIWAGRSGNGRSFHEGDAAFKHDDVAVVVEEQPNTGTVRVARLVGTKAWVVDNSERNKAVKRAARTSTTLILQEYLSGDRLECPSAW